MKISLLPATLLAAMLSAAAFAQTPPAKTTLSPPPATQTTPSGSQTPAATANQTPSSTSSPSPSAVQTNNPDSRTAAAPVPGRNSFTEGEASSRIQAGGYSDVKDLRKDDQGIWRGHAMKGGQAVPVALDYQGNVVSK